MMCDLIDFYMDFQKCHKEVISMLQVFSFQFIGHLYYCRSNAKLSIEYKTKQRISKPVRLLICCNISTQCSSINTIIGND